MFSPSAVCSIRKEYITVKDLNDICRVALIQASPVLFDKKSSVDKAVSLIREAGEQHPDLIVIPELFIPGYPFGMTFGYTIGARSEAGREDWKKYYDNSLICPGPETAALGEAAKAAGAYLSVGIAERDPLSATLYNANAFFTPDGKLSSVHRKLKPTGSERLIFGDADQGFFPVMSTPWGPAGCLICWESYMPLARVALYEKGVTIYISANTNDNPEWQDTIKHIAIEGHCFFINADLLIRRSDFPEELNARDEIEKLPDIICRGGSCIVDPFGHLVTEPVWDRETIICADLDMQMVPASRMEFDACGHYSRPDILKFSVENR